MKRALLIALILLAVLVGSVILRVVASDRTSDVDESSMEEGQEHRRGSDGQHTSGRSQKSRAHGGSDRASPKDDSAARPSAMTRHWSHQGLERPFAELPREERMRLARLAYEERMDRLEEAREIPQPWEGTRDWPDMGTGVVLGPREWMAQPSAELEEAIEEAFRAPKEPELPLEERLESIVLVEEHVDACFAELLRAHPYARGRIALIWDLVREGDERVIQNVNTTLNYRLTYPDFVMCSLGVEGLRFVASTDNKRAMIVEHPIFYDGY